MLIVSLASCRPTPGVTSTASANPYPDTSVFVDPQPDPPAVEMDEEILAFVYEGMVLIDTILADLNGDGSEDALVVLEDSSSEAGERFLILLVRDSTGLLQKAGENHYAVYCRDCGGTYGNPYNGIVIKGTSFTVENFGGASSRWADFFTFGYDPHLKDWVLKEIRNETYIPSEENESNSYKSDTLVKVPKDFGVVRFSDPQHF